MWLTLTAVKPPTPQQLLPIFSDFSLRFLALRDIEEALREWGTPSSSSSSSSSMSLLMLAPPEQTLLRKKWDRIVQFDSKQIVYNNRNIDATYRELCEVCPVSITADPATAAPGTRANFADLSFCFFAPRCFAEAPREWGTPLFSSALSLSSLSSTSNLASLLSSSAPLTSPYNKKKSASN
jgi:hypothetical protein